MASGDEVASLRAVVTTGTLSAQLGFRASASSPTGGVAVARFDDTTVEYLDFHGCLEGYDGGGLTLELVWSAATATTSTATWGAAFRRLADEDDDIDGIHTYSYNDAAAANAPGASGQAQYTTITFTDGVDMDSLADGERFILRVRLTSAALTGDSELWYPMVVLRET